MDAALVTFQHSTESLHPHCDLRGRVRACVELYRSKNQATARASHTIVCALLVKHELING